VPATILLFVSSLTVWSNRQLLDSDAWANWSTQLLANDQVRGAFRRPRAVALVVLMVVGAFLIFKGVKDLIA